MTGWAEKQEKMSRKTLHIHIGSHKTATTALQNTFSVSDDLLLKAGILFPKAGRKYQAHHPLAWQLRNAEQANTALENLGDWPAMMEEFDASPADVAIISSEDLEWIQDLGRLELLKQRYDVRILFYMRSPEKYLESFYNQIVKDFPTRETRTIETYMVEHGLFFLDNNKILNRWSDAFGQENVKVRLFGSDYQKGSITDDFMAAIGCKTTVPFRKPDISVLQKASLPPDALEYLRLTNPFVNRQEGHHNFVVKLVRIAQGEHENLHETRAGQLSHKAQENILRRFAPGNRKVAQKYLGADRSPFRAEHARAHPNFQDRMPEANAAVVAKVAAMVRNSEI